MPKVHEWEVRHGSKSKTHRGGFRPNPDSKAAQNWRGYDDIDRTIAYVVRDVT